MGSTLLATALGQMPEVQQLVCHHRHAAVCAMRDQLLCAYADPLHFT